MSARWIVLFFVGGLIACGRIGGDDPDGHADPGPLSGGAATALDSGAGDSTDDRIDASLDATRGLDAPDAFDVSDAHDDALDAGSDADAALSFDARPPMLPLIACAPLHTSSVAAPPPPEYLHETLSDPSFPHGLLASGRVSVARLVYDPSIDSWLGPAPRPLANASSFGGCIWLEGDRVLCTGGQTCGMMSCSSTPSNRAMVLDASTGTWTSRAPMNHGRYATPMVKLADGRILVVASGAEIYDPAKDTWEDHPEIASEYAAGHVLVLLDDGRVLIAGGADATGRLDGSVELIYDPKTDTTDITYPMLWHTYAPSAVRLSDGRVLVAGGASGAKEGDTLVVTAQILDPKTGLWWYAEPLPVGLIGVGLVANACGGAIAIGGFESWSIPHRDALVWDAKANHWDRALWMLQPRGWSTVVPLSDGSIFVAGGGASAESEWSAERLFAE